MEKIFRIGSKLLIVHFLRNLIISLKFKTRIKKSLDEKYTRIKRIDGLFLFNSVLYIKKIEFNQIIISFFFVKVEYSYSY